METLRTILHLQKALSRYFHESRFFLRFSKSTRGEQPAEDIDNSNEENKDISGSRLSGSLNIPDSNICETRLYFKLTATNRMSGKNLWAEIFGPKVGKVGYF